MFYKLIPNGFGHYSCITNFNPMRKAFASIAICCALITAFGSCHGRKSGGSDNANAGDKAIKKKYAGLLGVEEKEVSNIKLYRFIDEWYATPYKYAGKTKAGVDCSGFTSNLLRDVYGTTLVGSANTMYEACDHVNEKNLKEGDLVFFKINNPKVSHVGIYLQNRRFVHASSSRGVVISNLDEAYYKKYFFKGGRAKQNSVGSKQ